MEYKQFGNYKVYEDGTVYSDFRKRFLKPDNTCFGYKQYTLSIDNEPKRFRAHQLVAKLFLQPPTSKDQVCVNHIDGNKGNNHYTNLEWASYEENNRHARQTGLNNVSKSNHDRWDDDGFRARVSEKLSIAQKSIARQPEYVNPRFRYRICDGDGNVYTRTELAEKLNFSQSYTDAIIARAAKGDYHQKLVSSNIKITDSKL